MITIFYSRVFKNPHLEVFFSNTSDPHAERLAAWISEKMGGLQDGDLVPTKPKPTTRFSDDVAEADSNLLDEDAIKECERSCPFQRPRGVTSGIKECPIWIERFPWTYEREMHRNLEPTIIHQTGYGSDRVKRSRVTVHDRSSAHFAAWHSTKRPVKDLGVHFELDDARAWMRLHFWACRTAGLFHSEEEGVAEMDNAADPQPDAPALSRETQDKFQKWYTQFLGHFVRVYESDAPPFAPYEVAWSSSKERLQDYLSAIESGEHGMVVVIDILDPREAMEKITYI